MEEAIVAIFSYFISLAVQKYIPLDKFMTEDIPLMYMMSVSSVILPCFLNRPSGRSTLFITTCSGLLRVVLLLGIPYLP